MCRFSDGKCGHTRAIPVSDDEERASVDCIECQFPVCSLCIQFLFYAKKLDFYITSAKAGSWEKLQPRWLLRQTDSTHHFGVTGIGAQEIEREVGPEAIQQVAALLVCDVEPLEGMLLVA